LLDLFSFYIQLRRRKCKRKLLKECPSILWIVHVLIQLFGHGEHVDFVGFQKAFQLVVADDEASVTGIL